MEEEEKRVLYAAIRWYNDVLENRDKLSPTETALFYAVVTLENTKSIKIPSSELYENEKVTLPPPHKLLDDLIKKSRKG